MSDSQKPSLNIITIGHIDHGKTTLTAALATVLAKHYGGDAANFEQFDQAPAANAPAINYSRVQYDTPARHYVQLDCPGHADIIKFMIAGAAPIDAAILVVSATDGPMPQSREHILLARQIGISHIIVFLNKCDMVDDQEALELVEMEVRELLSQYDFPGDDLPVIRGSAQKALEGAEEWEQTIITLSAHLDSYIPEPQRAIDLPFLLPIEEVLAIADGETALTGSIERGTIKVGDDVEIVGILDTVRANCVGIESQGQALDEGFAGNKVRLILRNISAENIERGQVLAAPDCIKAHSKFVSEVYILSKEEGGRHTPFFKGYRPQFNLRTSDFTGTIELPEGVEMVMPGDNCNMIVTLIASVAMKQGLRFAIREGGKTVGVGVVDQIIS